MEMEDEERDALLQMTPKQMSVFSGMFLNQVKLIPL